MQNIAYQHTSVWSNRPLSRAAASLVWGVALLGSTVQGGDDWMTWTSTYTHSPVQGGRVDQYAQAVEPLAQRDPTFQRSGYRHYRSTLQGGNSADNMHIVEQWGAPVVPYEQWRFPFRPYGTPYDAWGPQAPYGIINSNSTFNQNAGPSGFRPPHGYQPPTGSSPYSGQPPVGPIPGYGQGPSGYPGYPNHGYPAPANSNQGYPNAADNVPDRSNGFPLSPPYQNQPWFDGTYPVAPPLDNRSDREFFFKPQQ